MSFVVSGRHRGFDAATSRGAVLAMVWVYGRRIRELAGMRTLDVWYSRLDAQQPLNALEGTQRRKLQKGLGKGATAGSRAGPGRVTPVHPTGHDDGPRGTKGHGCHRRRWEAGRSRDGAVFAASYEIRVKGRLSDAMQAAFEGFEITTEPVETVLHGQALDQAALHGLLDRIQTLGLELAEVRRLARGSREQRAHPPESADR